MNKKVLYGVIAALAVMILLIIVMAVTSNKTENIDTNTDTNPATEQQSNDDTNKQEENLNQREEEDLEKYDLYSDDEKLVFSRDNRTYIVFEYKDNKVFSRKIYVKYASAEDAQKDTAGLEELEEGIKSVTTEGRYLIMECDAGEYEGLTTDQLRKEVSAIDGVEEITK